MSSAANRRLLAGLIDLALMLVWAGLLAAGILGFSAAGVFGGAGHLGLHLIYVVAVVLPVTIGLTSLEAGRFEATPGKRKLGLRVRRDPGGERIRWERSLVRNLLKFGLPWTLLYLAVVTVWISPVPAAWIGVVVALGVPVAYLVSLLVTDGRTIYDHLAGTMVVSTTAGRRFVED